MLLTEYETTMVVRPDIGGDAIEATLDRVRDAVKNRGGKLLSINHWGKKKLAYPIMKHTRGIYVHTVYLGRDDLVTEVERNLRIADSVLRFLTVRLEKDVDPGARHEQDYQPPEYDADEQGDEPEAMEAASEDDSQGEGSEGDEEKREAGATTEATDVASVPSDVAASTPSDAAAFAPSDDAAEESAPQEDKAEE